MSDDAAKKPKKKGTNTGAFLFVPMFNPRKAVEIAKKEIYAQAKPPDRFVDVLFEVDGARYEFTIDEFLKRLGVPGYGDAA